MNAIDKYVSLLEQSMGSHNSPLILKIKLKNKDNIIYGKVTGRGMFQRYSPSPTTPINPWSIMKIRDIDIYRKDGLISFANSEMMDININDIESLERFSD